MFADLLIAVAMAQGSAVPVEIIPPPYCAPGPPIVYFDRGEDQVAPQARAILDILAEPFLRYPVNTRMLVTGHTDSVGSPRANLALSRRRAANVRRYLIGRGIPASRLVVEAKGESEPEPSVSEDRDGKLNRRVSVIEQITDAERARREAAYPSRGNIQC